MQEFKVNASNVGQRVDVYVAARYPSFTRSSLRELFRQKLVSLNGTLTKPAEKIKAGDQIVVDEQLLKLEPTKIKLPIIYENGEVVVINKPPGILTHSKGALNLEDTVASFIKSKITDPKLTGNRAGIVHRLDRGTSGIMIAAKNSEALNKLQKQFSQRKTKKTYLALVAGIPIPDAAIIDIPIERNPKKPQIFQTGPGGKSAQTYYKVLKSFTKAGQPVSLVELRPTTGRTHQLRVHMAAVGHPFVGDELYGSMPSSRLWLHAQDLELTLPSGERRKFRAKLPEGFKNA